MNVIRRHLALGVTVALATAACASDTANKAATATIPSAGALPGTARATPLDPPTADQGSRRVWADSVGRVWVSEWNAGQVAVYDPRNGRGANGKCPAATRRFTRFYVDGRDTVWVSVRQLLGRTGEVWGAE